MTFEYRPPSRVDLEEMLLCPPGFVREKYMEYPGNLEDMPVVELDFLVCHRDGVSWENAPLPPKRHTCLMQTYARFESGYELSRCACGAVGDYSGHFFDQKNSRRTRQDSTASIDKSEESTDVVPSLHSGRRQDSRLSRMWRSFTRTDKR